jgi:hypothetical protein
MSVSATPIAVLLFAIVLLPTLAGCGSSSHPSSLVGKWKHEEGYGLIEFLQDGTACQGDDPRLGTWKVAGGRLHATSPDGEVRIQDYKISGTTLILTTSDGSNTFHKVK